MEGFTLSLGLGRTLIMYSGYVLMSMDAVFVFCSLCTARGTEYKKGPYMRLKVGSRVLGLQSAAVYSPLLLISGPLRMGYRARPFQ